jgi:hypothetical protein
LPASCTITILPVFFTVSASAAFGSGFIERTSMSWIEGAGFGGLSFAGKKGSRDGGGFCSSRMARTAVSPDHHHHEAKIGRTAGVQGRAVRDEREVCALAKDLDVAQGKCVVVYRDLLDWRQSWIAVLARGRRVHTPAARYLPSVGTRARKIFGSSTSVGLGSRTAANSSPFAWMGVRGMTTFSPAAPRKYPLGSASDANMPSPGAPLGSASGRVRHDRHSR